MEYVFTKRSTTSSLALPINFNKIYHTKGKSKFPILHDKPPLANKTRKNTTKNWIKIARAHKLSLFKDFSHKCGRVGIFFKQVKNTEQNNRISPTFLKSQKNT